jgi:hypothetical protein
VIFDYDAAADSGHITRHLPANANRAGNASEFAGFIVRTDGNIAAPLRVGWIVLCQCSGS